jgi:hypothetical protein
MTNFHNIKNKRFSDITESFIKLYNEILLLPEETMEKDYVISMSQIGYVVYYKYLEENGYDDILAIYNEVDALWHGVRLFHTEPYLTSPEFNNDRFGIHKDTGDGYNPSAAINWPLINCNKNSVTKWYKIINGEPIITQNYIYADHCEVEEVQSTSLMDNNPMLFRIDVFHSMDNKSNKKRVLASWPFKEGVSWKNSVKIMQNLHLI